MIDPMSRDAFHEHGAKATINSFGFRGEQGTRVDYWYPGLTYPEPVRGVTTLS